MVRTLKILLPAIPLAAIGIALASGGLHSNVRDEAGSVTTQAATDSQTVPPVDVTVNGQPIKLPPSGHATVNTGSGQATVDVSGNGGVQTQSSGSGSGTSNVNISVSTDSSSGNSDNQTFFSSDSFQQTQVNSDVNVSTNSSSVTVSN